MSNRAYSEINLHIVWHVMGNLPVLRDDVEGHLRNCLKSRVGETPNVLLRALGGTEDHVHLAVSVPPELLVSKWIGELKGASAHYVNHRIGGRKVVEWQTGYGVVSFGTRYMRWVADYVAKQREHHASGKTVGRLECFEPEGEAR